MRMAISILVSKLEDFPVDFDIPILNAHDDLALMGIYTEPSAYLRLSERQKSDREFLLAAVKKNGEVLEYAADERKADREIVLAAVKQDGYALEYASETVRNDRKIVLAAVGQNGMALKYASEAFKKDAEICLVALRQNSGASSYISDALELSTEHIFELTKPPYWTPSSR